MDMQQAYDVWAHQYDTNENKTRDGEGVALRNTLAGLSFGTCLEIGCGTGKNTEWLMGRAQKVTAVDLSEEMLAKAKEKIESDRVQFVQADINKDWTFTGGKQYHLISFSLVLEHIEHLEAVFKQVAQSIIAGGYVYIGELHPFKQYAGTKARFDTQEGVQVVDCFKHHVSDFMQAAKQNRLSLIDLDEHFDSDDRTGLPRILTLLFRKD